MNRLEAFLALKDHPWLGRHFVKLSGHEIAFCRGLLRSMEAMSKGDFESFVNRLFLDQEKPKHHTLIKELLSCANSTAEEK